VEEAIVGRGRGLACFFLCFPPFPALVLAHSRSHPRVCLGSNRLLFSLSNMMILLRNGVQVRRVFLDGMTRMIDWHFSFYFSCATRLFFSPYAGCLSTRDAEKEREKTCDTHTCPAQQPNSLPLTLARPFSRTASRDFARRFLFVNAPRG
jgi:hypothetical protein